MYYKSCKCTCERGCGFKPPPPEDISSWCRSVLDYIKDSRANRLDLQNVHWYGVNWGDADIQSIFDSLADSNITEINLKRNKLNDKIKKLCEVLSKTKTEKLNLASCSLTVDDFMSLMAVLKDTRITALDVSSNSTRLEKTQQIKKFIAHLVNSHLRFLNISNNGVLPFEKVSVLFQRLPDTKLTCLDLSKFFSSSGFCHNNHVNCLDTLLSSLQHTTITDLNLTSNFLGDDLAKAIGPIIGKSKLERLNLRENKLTDVGVDCLIPGLINSKITHLNLFGNMIKGDNSLGRCLKDTKIKELDLSRNSITSRRIFSGSNFLQGSTVNILKLCTCFCSNETIPLHIKTLKFSELTYLDLGGNTLNFEHVSALADVLSSSKLTHINLGYNRFSEKCYNVIGDCLIKSKLKYINLSATERCVAPQEKRISCSRGIASIIEKTKGSAIVSIDLSNNDLHNCVDIIAPALANTTFSELDLSGNRWRYGIVSLAQHLKLTTLTVLHLNHIGDDGAIALSKHLEETQIVILTLVSSSITNRGAKALSAVLKKTKLRHLDLESNSIENDGLEILATHAKSTCITYLNVDNHRSPRKLLIERVMLENRKEIQIFADLLKQTALFTGDSNIFEFDRDFENVDMNVFIEDCLKVYKIVLEKPFIVGSIEQDKCITALKQLGRFDCDSYSYANVFIEDSLHIYQKVLEQSAPVQTAGEEDENVSFFKKQMLWLMLEEYPKKFVSFIERVIAADVEQYVSLLRKIEELGLTGIEGRLLLNRCT